MRQPGEYTTPPDKTQNYLLIQKSQLKTQKYLWHLHIHLM